MEKAIDLEGSPIPDRSDSTLSVIKIQPATRSKRGRLPLLTQKFSDPEIEELYQLHSTNRKRTELFPCFLYAILFYCIAQIIVNSFWIVDRNNDDRARDLHGTDGDSNTLLPDNPDHVIETYGEGGENRYLHQRLIIEETKPLLFQAPDFHALLQKDSFKSNDDHTYKPRRTIRRNKRKHLAHTTGSNTFENSTPNLRIWQSTNDDFTWKNNGTESYMKTRHLAGGKNYESESHEPSKLRISTLQMSYHAHPDLLSDQHEQNSTLFSVTTFGAFAFTMIVTIFMLIPSGTCKGNPHIPVILWSVTIFLTIIVRNDLSLPLRLGLGWVLLETFLIWFTLPLRLRSTLIYTFLLIVIHSIIVFVKGPDQHFKGWQLGVNLILLVTTNVLGILAYYLSDKKQRRAFLDTRQSLEMKLVIEEQVNEQERLLLSVLPEHLALKIRQDLGATGDGQFQTIYMSRHENVSILYADIVGFTAISSTYSASELVKILNELFARFDKLADKYHQLRIKILGDCYYCICGAPEEREDHAVLSVHMGLSMVKAIKYLQETTNSPVDMRVGIHTGAILAGVLGQRQWQFDVYSKDVELANKMESSGMKGRVHVSDKTLAFLNNEFEVEPAYGERREEILRISGIKTYFIVRALKPVKLKSLQNSGVCEITTDDEVAKELVSDLNSAICEDSASAVEENGSAWKEAETKKQSRATLQDELNSRKGLKDLSQQSQWFTLQFHDSQKESQFVAHKEPNAGISSLAAPLALTAFAISNFFIISFTILGLITSIIALIILISISIFSAYGSDPVKTQLKNVSTPFMNQIRSLESKLWVRRLLGIFTIFVLTAANAIFSIPCFEAGSQCSKLSDKQLGEYNLKLEPPIALPARSIFSSLGCLFPAYLILFCSLLLFSITMLSQPGFWIKSLAIFFVLVVHVTLLNVQDMRAAFECSEKFSFLSRTDLILETWQLTIYIVVIFLVLFVLNRRLEKSSRILFLWKSEMEQQKERAAQLRQKNESLVYNILPQHVASHFLGSRQRKHEELYSQSYSEVGVLFASMPNFTDFYSEETVNNQGLECLRFLNEVISDFDALLELPRFKDNIFKIKTISSTYMAASGLSPSKQVKPDNPLRVRWTHLSLLVEFAFELKRALTSINEQSFNHFVLKMGINHGPITAGVIGARKPHYDIWGNSVNVASRMESTGKAGCIQVTEETYKILLIFGYQFEQRGLVNVKGKGQLMTYYLTGRGPELTEKQVEELLEKHSQQEPNNTSHEIVPPPPPSEKSNHT